MTPPPSPSRGVPLEDRLRNLANTAVPGDPLHTFTTLPNPAISSQQTQTSAQPLKQAGTSGAGNQDPVLPNAVTSGNSYF